MQIYRGYPYQKTIPRIQLIGSFIEKDWIGCANPRLLVYYFTIRVTHLDIQNWSTAATGVPPCSLD